MKKFLLLILFFMLFFPFKVYALDLIPNSKSGILVEVNSGKVIFEKEKDMRVSVASMTKIAAQIIVFEEISKNKIKWDDVVVVSHNASGMGGSQIYLEEGENITVRDLMKGISVASGNDATVAMAEYISGSEEAFVKRMNKLVHDLGLKNTHFVNCTGLDEKDHYSSAYDMSILARELLTKYPDIIQFSSIYEDYLREGTDNKFWLVNTNKLVRLYNGCDGLKTGHTDEAGYCLAATAKRNNLRLVAIVLGEDDSNVRNRETMELLDYGFNNIKMNCILKKGTVVDKVYIDKTKDKEYDVILKDDLCVIEDKDNYYKYNYKTKIDNIVLPLNKNHSIGKLNVYHDKKSITSIDVCLKKNVRKINYLSFVFENIYNLFFGLF